MASRILLEEMTWREIKQEIDSGKTNALVPTASIEQHGPHLPTATDTLIGYELAKEVAKRLRNALVAPVVRPGLSEHHLGFPGTFTTRIDNFVRIVQDYCECLAMTGFKNIFVFSSHGGNSDTIVTYAPRWHQAMAGRCKVYGIPIDVYFGKERNYLLDKGISLGRSGGHAGFSETSIMLYLHPQLVRMEYAETGLADDSFYSPENLKRSQLDLFSRGMREESPNGVLGDPLGSDPEIGKGIFEIAVKALEDEIRSYLR